MREANLNEQKKSIMITLADKRFEIKRVVTGVLQLYGEYMKDVGTGLEQIGYLQEKMDKLSTMTPEEVEETNRELEGISAEVEDFNQKKLDRLLRMIELLLEKNGHEFDREWWIENADISDYQNFITAAINKDVPEGVKKNPPGQSTGTG